MDDGPDDGAEWGEMGRMMGRNGAKWGEMGRPRRVARANVVVGAPRCERPYVGGMGRNGAKWGGMGRPRRVARANVVVGAPLCGRPYVRAPLGNVRAPLGNVRAPYFRGLLMMYRRTR